MGKRVRHFVGVESSAQLAFIDELQRLGLSSTINLPELVVVGDQSTGKSSVLQAITEVSFPVKDTMCTRFPIQISFRQTSTLSAYPVKATIVPGRVSENDEALRIRIKDFVIEKEELTPEVMEEIIDKATKCIFGEQKPGKQLSLSDATLRIERSGPDEMHWTIVDLPGLIRKGQKSKKQVGSNATDSVAEGGSQAQPNAAVAWELARSYLKNERNIILVVIDNVDVERHKTFELIEAIDGLESRCIGVLTKCDRKQEGSDDWMVKLLQNDLPTVPHLDHGWFGLRNRIPTETNITDAERDERETNEFAQKAWEGVAKNRTGIRSLMTYVDKERRSQIQSGIPHIIAEIRQKLQDCESTLNRMGEARDSPKAQRYFVFQFCNEMQKMAEATLRGQYQDVPSQNPKIRLRYEVNNLLDKFYDDMVNPENMQIRLSNYEQDLIFLSTHSSDPKVWEEQVKNATGIYSEICEEAKISEGRNLPGTVSPDVEEKIFRKLTTHWEGIARKFIEDVKNLMKDCYDVLLKIAIPNSKVRLEVSRIVGRTLEEWTRDAETALRELLEDNRTRPLVTRNPKFEHDTRGADQQRGEILQGMKTTKARSVDRATNAMQVIERHVLGPKCPMLTVSVKTFAKLDDEELNTVAGEDDADIRMRAKLERVRSRYVKALEKWEGVRVL